MFSAFPRLKTLRITAIRRENFSFKQLATIATIQRESTSKLEILTEEIVRLSYEPDLTLTLIKLTQLS